MTKFEGIKPTKRVTSYHLKIIEVFYCFLISNCHKKIEDLFT